MGIIKNTILNIGLDKDFFDINIVLKNQEEIFKHYDYIAEKGNRLNQELEDYIFSSVKRQPLNKNTRLVIHMTEEKVSFNSNKIKKAIHDNFMYKVHETELYLANQFKQWIINMIIGVLFLILCFLMGEILDKFSYIKLLRVIKESLSIVGWVALWEPISFILFGRKTIKRDKVLYEKISMMPIITIKESYKF